MQVVQTVVCIIGQTWARLARIIISAAGVEHLCRLTDVPEAQVVQVAACTNGMNFRILRATAQF